MELKIILILTVIILVLSIALIITGIWLTRDLKKPVIECDDNNSVNFDKI